MLKLPHLSRPGEKLSSTKRAPDVKTVGGHCFQLSSQHLMPGLEVHRAESAREDGYKGWESVSKLESTAWAEAHQEALEPWRFSSPLASVECPAGAGTGGGKHRGPRGQRSCWPQERRADAHQLLPRVNGNDRNPKALLLPVCPPGLAAVAFVALPTGQHDSGARSLP